MNEQNTTDLSRAVETIRSGGVVLLPTDTVYGIAADPLSADPMSRLFDMKERPRSVPIALLVASVEQASALVEVNPVFERLAKAHWPGPLTLVARRRTDVELFVGDTTTLGVRMPDHRLLLDITTEIGPIAATSANRHGQPTLTDPAEASEVFAGEVDLVIDGGRLAGLASTVVDTTGETLRVLRHGPIEVTAT